MNPQVDQNKINKIIESRFIKVSPAIKKRFPGVLKNKFSWFVFTTNSYIAIIFGDQVEEKRIKKLMQKKLHPFPGLIADNPSLPVAIRLEKTQKNMMVNCKVGNTYSFSLGEDSSVILRNHHQSINIADHGVCDYNVALAYILSFGPENNQETIYQHLDDLIAYSMQQWEVYK